MYNGDNITHLLRDNVYHKINEPEPIQIDTFTQECTSAIKVAIDQQFDSIQACYAQKKNEIYKSSQLEIDMITERRTEQLHNLLKEQETELTAARNSRREQIHHIINNDTLTMRADINVDHWWRIFFVKW
jgi:hypothetical protein